MERPDVLEPGDARPAARAALREWLALQNAAALYPERIVEPLRRGATPLAALRMAPGCPRRSEVDAALRSLARAGACALPFTSDAYPPQLRNLSDPPALLLVRGDVAALSALGVAIVGSRAATSYGLGVARELAGELARAGLVIISGLARGIDAACHRAALAAGGRTVAVQACGPDLVYPPEHRELAEEIAASGAVATELPPGARPRRRHFPLRNRLISGLSAGVVVVEARQRSGSLITARHALDQGLEVFAVPGPVNAPTSTGPNRLLCDGAWPVTCAADVIGALAFGETIRRRSRDERTGDADPRHDPILAALRHEPATRDELVRRLGVAPEALALALVELQLAGDLHEDPDGRLRAR